MACNERTKLIEHRDEERHVGQHPHLDQEVAVALQKSEDGRRLLEYDDLPHSWKNNPFVVHGYRYVPLSRFPVLVASVFMAHNEFLNIQTHLLPLLFWVLTVPETIAETIFTVCVLICLASSVVWHTMAGCAHYETLVFCARLDYIGIGWLISACTASIVLYAFDDRILLQWAFLGLSFVTAVMGSILPFMDWFDRHHNRLWRLAFFISLACVTAIPLLTYWTLEGSAKMLHFLCSCCSAITGANLLMPCPSARLTDRRMDHLRCIALCRPRPRKIYRPIQRSGAFHVCTGCYISCSVACVYSRWVGPLARRIAFLVNWLSIDIDSKSGCSYCIHSHTL
ncbi:unnamed protein product [Mycena citricolor]|uniref:Uncharacterized protein n=1 Tax=Mycena citricolor TaxID=2018698 RepID=A0AAD2HU30_9AGAR|nr:unnamed protein product [Mycena citricolor]